MKISISRRGLATRTVMYHGTTSKFLRSILKKGLDPRAKTRVWADDHGANARNTSRKSLPRVYATTNYMTAQSSSTTAAEKLGG
jgi:RNA:NAD 2'-phosphotransferase (TPT1/KptA family)